MKTCTKCNLLFPKENFYRQSKSKDGLHYECKSCCNKRTKEFYLKNNTREKIRKKKHYLANKDKILSRNKMWKENNKEKYHDTIKNWNNNNKEKLKDYRLKYVYGVSSEEFGILKAEQNNKCKICKKKRKLVVDHCHTTGKIRGLLCSTCNSGIGMLKDNIDYLQNAIIYLKE